jgi:hypothetical protein
MDSRSRVIVLGFDGLDPGFFNLLGIKNYKNSILARSDPGVPLTYPSWSSIMTGVNPGKHGLIDFFKYYRTSSGWRAKLLSALDLDYPRIHEIIGIGGYAGRIKTLALNPIPALPLIPVKDVDIMSVAFFTPNPQAHPRELINKYDLTSIHGLYREFYNARREGRSCRELVEIIVDILEHYRGVLEELGEYDFVWFAINIPDIILHVCSEEAAENRSLLEPVFSGLGRIASEALKMFNDVFIVSDHGFKEYERLFNVNRLLYDQGYIVEGGGGFIEHEWRKPGSPHKEVSVSRTIYGLARKIIRGPLKNAVKKLLSSIGYEVSVEPGIDPISSKAFMPLTRSRHIPLRYTLLLNDPSIASEITGLLRQYDLEAYTPRELFNGPHIVDHIVYVYGGSRTHPTPGAIHTPLVARKKFMQHARYGILYIRLEGETPSHKPEVLPNTVTTPIILYRLSVPLQYDLDSIDLVAKLYSIDKRDLKLEDYLGRWRILKRLASLKTRTTYLTSKL